MRWQPDMQQDVHIQRMLVPRNRASIEVAQTTGTESAQVELVNQLAKTSRY